VCASQSVTSSVSNSEALPAIEADDEFAAVLADALKPMPQAGREVPEPSFMHVFHIGPTELADGRYATRAILGISPFSRKMSMQLTNPAACKAHIHAGGRFRNLTLPE
jgi:hypothetical protein